MKTDSKLTGWNGIAVDFITPTGIIAECIDGTLDIEIGLSKWLSIVKRFKIGKCRLVLLNQIGQPGGILGN